ncbi:UPF0041 protein [Lentinula edodes]|uniref:Mitochondrial pyruvate carrier n=1 Tax=Lentinula edodes TaxID=5353 RepID=A0A1Q3E805_LENED|nr:UPF0041 protein [Lentinula edodes]
MATTFAKFFNHPADGVLLGASDEVNLALTATGFIWVRYSFVIIPVNYSLAAVNFFVGLSGITQLGRIAHHQYTQGQLTAPTKA